MSWIKLIETFIGLFGKFTADGPVEILRRTRVTYGVASSSYHTIWSFRDCASSSEISTEVGRAILIYFQFADILTGTNSNNEARTLRKLIEETVKRGRFDLRKWTSNESSINLDLSPEYREANDSFENLDNDHTKKRSVMFGNTAKIASFLRFPISKRTTLGERF